LRTIDYLVGGAGSAGAVLAARLSEDPRVSVVVLEAGRNYCSAERAPALSGFAIPPIVALGGYHWPQICAQLTPVHDPSLYVRALGVGGSSAINAAEAVRGLAADFEAWQASGCQGWGWTNTLDAFMKLEDDLDFGDRPHQTRAVRWPSAA
jgi:choline dehydrogenase